MIKMKIALNPGVWRELQGEAPPDQTHDRPCHQMIDHTSEENLLLWWNYVFTSDHHIFGTIIRRDWTTILQMMSVIFIYHRTFLLVWFCSKVKLGWITFDLLLTLQNTFTLDWNIIDHVTLHFAVFTEDLTFDKSLKWSLALNLANMLFFFHFHIWSILTFERGSLWSCPCLEPCKHLCSLAVNRGYSLHDLGAFLKQFEIHFNYLSRTHLVTILTWSFRCSI